MSTAVERRQLARECVKAKTIAFDTWPLASFARHQGVHVYARNLLSQFRELGPQYEIEIRPYVCERADNDANGCAAAPGFRPRRTGLLRFSRLWRFGGACWLASLQRVDLVFSPHCTSLYAGSFAPAVVTIHDVIPSRLPWGSERITRTLRFLSWSAAKFSRAIITLSHHSKADLLELYRIPESKVFVIYNGYDKKIFNCQPADPELLHSLLARLGVTRPYILHHGAVKPNKNLKRLVQARRLLRERNKNLDFDLVLAGPLGWEYGEVMAEAKKNPGVILTGALSDQDLSLLVKGASLAVIPSLYEGFCLPMIEAMACGTPTIASRSSCLREISADALRYFNPESVDEMAACMEEVLENSDLRTELSAKGQLRANEFDWRRCAEETMSVLRTSI